VCGNDRDCSSKAQLEDNSKLIFSNNWKPIKFKCSFAHNTTNIMIYGDRNVMAVVKLNLFFGYKLRSS